MGVQVRPYSVSFCSLVFTLSCLTSPFIHWLILFQSHFQSALLLLDDSCQLMQSKV